MLQCPIMLYLPNWDGLISVALLLPYHYLRACFHLKCLAISNCTNCKSSTKRKALKLGTKWLPQWLFCICYHKVPPAVYSVLYYTNMCLSYQFSCTVTSFWYRFWEGVRESEEGRMWREGGLEEAKPCMSKLSHFNWLNMCARKALVYINIHSASPGHDVLTPNN